MRASEAGRAIICPASLVLPRVPRTPSESRDRAAAWGTLCHHWKETGEIDPSWADPRDTKTLEKKLVLSGVERETWWPSSEGTHEVTFALALDCTPLSLMRYDPGQQLANRDAWKAGFGRWYLTGTIDWLVGGDGTMALVDDLKTGRWPVDVTTSKQLRAYALMPWVAAGMPTAWDGLVSITAWPKYPLGGQPERTTHRLSYLDLMETLVDLQYAAENPDEVTPDEEACRFCDCKPLCPAWVDSNQELEETE